MFFQEIFYIFLMGLIFGLLLTVIWDFLEKRVLLRKSKIEAKHLVQEAEERMEDHLSEQTKKSRLVNEQKLSEFEKEKKALQVSFQTIQSEIDLKKTQISIENRENSRKIKSRKKERLEFKKSAEGLVEKKHILRKSLQEHNKNQADKLSQKFSIDLTHLKGALKEEIKEHFVKQIKKKIEKEEKSTKQSLQKEAFFQLHQILNRIDRAYCSERGIKPVSFKNLKHLSDVLGKDNSYLSEIEKECGVDIVVDKEELIQASIFGIDPVRRELGRLSVQKLSNRRKIDFSLIKKTVKMNKRNLFSKIRSDGRQICKKLGLKNVAPTVQNMLGALRYRYSFAQNQYFHCEEVGWLCGLLNAEMSLPIGPARRAGLFHDIGKAMDHSIEGNHAVIGAEFLSKYNESEEVLHAVRAHHHDETPSTALAYLVIAADSISGSRPGARRFTEDSYNQKMASLEKIIDSFENIEDAYIMNAGREMRIIVNNEKVKDQEALKLSQLIARKIERECAYPGLIKVTVVRHSETVATA